MNKRRDYRHFIAVGVVGYGFAIASANAAVVENITIGSAKALALGNAVTADPPGIDAIHYNPAGLADVDGRIVQLKGIVAAFQFDATFGEYTPAAQEQIDYWGVGQDEIENSESSTTTAALKLPFMEETKEWPLPFIVVPLAGVAYSPPGSDLTFATSVYAPVAAGYQRDEDDPGRYMGKYLSVVRLTYFSPTVAWKVNDEWSLGFGVETSWQGVGANTDLRVPNLVLGVVNAALEEIQATPFACDAVFGDSAEICDPNTPIINPLEKAAELTVEVSDPFTWTATFGVLWKPVPYFTWGARYLSGSSMHLTGTYNMQYTDYWVQPFSRLSSQSVVSPVWNFLDLPKGLAEESGDASIDLDWPAQFSTGISVQLTPQWKINIDGHWMDWAKWDGLDVKFDRKTDFLRIASILQPEYANDSTLIIPRHYKSVWNYALGVQYQYSEPLALRLGYENRRSSVPDSKQDVLLPLGDAQLFGAGLEYQVDRYSVLELAGGYLLASADIPAGTSTNANSMDTASSFIYNPYSGMDIETKAQGVVAEINYTTLF